MTCCLEINISMLHLLSMPMFLLTYETLNIMQDIAIIYNWHVCECLNNHGTSLMGWCYTIYYRILCMDQKHTDVIGNIGPHQQ